MASLQTQIDRFAALMERAPYDAGAWRQSMSVIAEMTDACSVQWAGWADERIPSVMMLNVDDAIFADWLAAGGATLANPLVAASMTQRPLTTLASHEVVSDTARRKSELWGHVHPRHDMPHVCSGKIWADGPSLLTLNVMHNSRQGPIDDERRGALEAALVSANQAVRVARTLGADGARLLTAGLDAVGAAAFVLDGYGQLLAMSAKAADHVDCGSGLRLRTRRLSAYDAADDQDLQAAIGGAIRRYPGISTASRDVLIRRPTPGPVSVLTVTPLPEQAGLSLAGATALIVARHSLAGLLTAAERGVLAMLIDGASVADIAQARGSSKETVRSQIKMIYAKVEVSSRGELMALFASGRLSL